ncbi:4-hydroxy-3-methylbut-2-enyl diphosphate reductase [Nibricoccus aquaticus]|uniref:4-hydroxy-3-methylbut-2-enyl diphosphate reductase n=2 Tax=Nibricoccus aquaticus TaxID=2576891 RepID=A0A290QC12_9BACT|nr:4-hydroxy-3-methylbut-2-enyl diphosphate reductase [Nibricoccus aquaticus]
MSRDGRYESAFQGEDLDAVNAELHRSFPEHTPSAEYFCTTAEGTPVRVFFSQVPASSGVIAGGCEFRSLAELEASPESLSPTLAAILAGIDPYLIEIPYLHLGENDFIYKFRTEKSRNRGIYQLDDAARTLYQSKLCAAIKALARTHERTAAAPVALDFGAVQYLLPSHFGFCLGVKNAIERAYETLAENPTRRVFMLSELIHNPFVNEDLLRRGLRYLQTDKGKPHLASGGVARGEPGEVTLWDTLTSEDIVIIPAFGATDDDKRRLVRKGVPVYQYDATCMLVEKVWKAARALGQEGYTVVIHGKHEHEETKATFSNARRHAHAVIVRNLEETRRLGELITSRDPAERAKFYSEFAGKHTPGFDVDRDFARIAIVNQTTLLMNETLEIIDHLREVFSALYGDTEATARVGGGGKRDTLCYATQVNQDALSRALAEPLDAAFVIGGKNSSNTYQLYRLCEQRLGKRAFFIQSEANIQSRDAVEHYVFPAKGPVGGHGHDMVEIHPLPVGESGRPFRVLLTGGASCPDGIIQQVITRINSLFPATSLRSVDAVLADVESAAASR